MWSGMLASLIVAKGSKIKVVMCSHPEAGKDIADAEQQFTLGYSDG